MTLQSTDKWTCDRCGVIDERTQSNQPPDWIGLVIVTPPLHVINDSGPNMRMHLCAECNISLNNWMLNK